MKVFVSALLGGLILGGIGFAAGFFGPILLTPEANQGPLLGIFITGPLGFVVGLLLGGLYGLRTRTSEVIWVSNLRDDVEPAAVLNCEFRPSQEGIAE
jgi:hypothetical protein